jgi:hypothetical protein
MTAKKDRPFLEALLTNVEAAVDLATDNEAVKAVPVIGTAFKLLKGLDEVRSKALAAKLRSFLTAPELQSERIRAKLRSGIASSAEEAEKIGEGLFLVLERMLDLDKPRLLARVFVAFLDGDITAEDLRRLSQALDLAFVDDLNLLRSWGSHVNSRRTDVKDWLSRLVVAGITAPRLIGAEFGIPSVNYEMTRLGNMLCSILQRSKYEA